MDNSIENDLVKLQEENRRLRAALQTAVNCMDGMAYDAFLIGLEGTSDWDKTAGNRNLHGAIDTGRIALGVSTR